MRDDPSDHIQAGYDLIAGEYAKRLSDELDHKPLDRQLLDQFAMRVKALGLVCDMGCGPGHVGRYLLDRGVAVVGLDLSSEMVTLARKLTPGITFRQGDMRALEVGDDAWGGIVAFYSLIHIPRSELVAVLAEWHRVLVPGGLVFVAFHIGDGVLHLDEWWGHQISVDFVHFQPDEMTGFLIHAGFLIAEVIERDPYPGAEHQSRRAFLLARKPYREPGSNSV